jgi:hypothetical protein
MNAPLTAPLTATTFTAPISAEQTVRILRERYPDALVCTGRRCVSPLIATQRASYAKSNLTEERRLNFTCPRCRQDAMDAAAVRAARSANLVVARAAQRDINPAPVGEPVFLRDASATPVSTRAPEGVNITVGRGGRPRKHRGRKVAVAAANRAYRARQRARQRASGDGGCL